MLTLHQCRNLISTCCDISDEQLEVLRYQLYDVAHVVVSVFPLQGLCPCHST